MTEGKMFEVDTVICLVVYIQKPQILMHTIEIAGASLSYWFPGDRKRPKLQNEAMISFKVRNLHLQGPLFA